VHAKVELTFSNSVTMKLLFVLCALVAYSQVWAQDVSVSFSSPFSLRDKGLTQKEGQTFRVGDFYFCMETSSAGKREDVQAKQKVATYNINLYKFDSTMKLLDKVVIDGQGDLGPFGPNHVLFAGKLLIFFYKVSDLGDVRLQFSTVDPGTMAVSPAQELNLIAEKGNGLIDVKNSFELNRLGFGFNADSSKLMVVQSSTDIDVFCTAVIGQELTFGKPVISPLKSDLKDFVTGMVCLDDAGNKYFTYDYIEKNKRQHGIILQSAAGKDTWPDLQMPDGVTTEGLLWLRPSRDKSKVYFYGIAKGNLQMRYEVGVLMATIDVARFRLGNFEFFPYPEDMRENLRKMDFAERTHGNVEVKNTFYVSNELEDGTLALTGYPEDVEQGAPMSHLDGSSSQSSTVFAGPIINIFIKGRKASFGVIYRNQEMTDASMFIAVPYHDKLVCIYNDSEKSVGSNDLGVNGSRFTLKEVVLAVAVFRNDGTTLSRRKLADKQGRLTYFTNAQQELAGGNVLIPLGEDKLRGIRYFTDYEQWATVGIR
jgi:hypothetical protein